MNDNIHPFPGAEKQDQEGRLRASLAVVTQIVASSEIALAANLKRLQAVCMIGGPDDVSLAREQTEDTLQALMAAIETQSKLMSQILTSSIIGGGDGAPR